MNFLAPAAFWFFLLAVPILLLYMLKLRRKPVTIPSTMLWQRLLRDRQANAPWQRLRHNLLLLLQLLILGALVLALARPAQTVPGVAADTVIILLDASASMNATDVMPSRFEAARQIVESYLTNLPQDARMTIISVGPEPQILASNQGDRSQLRQALQTAAASQGPADWKAAFTLAAGAAGSAASSISQNIATVIISDGGLPEAKLPGLPGKVVFLPIGQDGYNLAITALAVRASQKGPELFTRVKNYGPLTQRMILSIYADGRILQSRQIELGGGEDRPLIINDLPSLANRYEARLQPTNDQDDRFNDHLALDNRAVAVYRPAENGKVLLASSGNLFLEQVLSSLEGVQAYRILPGEDGSLELPQQGFDLYVLDGILPDPLPKGNILWVNPPSSELLPSSGFFTDTFPAEVVQSPLTEYVDWQDIHILRARQIQTPDWALTLIQAPGGPLVLAGEVQGQRMAAISFDLHESDLPLKLAFPILVANLIEYLQPGSLYQLNELPALLPGQRISLPAARSSGTLRLIDPNGGVSDINADVDGQFLLQLDQAGLYQLSDPTQPGSDAYLAVNLFDPQESRLTPSESILVGQQPIMGNNPAESGQRELWPWLAASAMLIFWLEWWLYHRRQKLPGDWPDKLVQRLRSSKLWQKAGGAHG